jgi:3-deoxy-D-manno-octulosonic-acid transferase
MTGLFNFLYVLALLLGCPLLLWRRWTQGKRIAGAWAKFRGSTGVQGDRPRIWLHAVSVGEVNLLAILVPALRRALPDYEMVVSTTTRTGREVAEKRFAGIATVVWFPWDFSWAVQRAMREIQPQLIVLSELELWPNFLRIARQRAIPVAVVNGRLSERSARGYQRWRWLLGDLFASLDLVAAQSATYAERFAALGVPAKQIAVTGNLKFDGAEFDRGNPRTRELASLLQRRGNEIYWLAGSTQEPEEAICVQVYTNLRERFPQLRLLLAPRHPERAATTSSGAGSERRAARCRQGAALRPPFTARCAGRAGQRLGAADRHRR